MFDIITSFSQKGEYRNCVNMSRAEVTRVSLRIENQKEVIGKVMEGLGGTLLAQNMTTFQGGQVAILALQVEHTDAQQLEENLRQLPGVLSCKCS